MTAIRGVDVPVSTRNPYQGLRPFQPSDWRFFCGRKAHVAEILQRLQNNRFVAVVGLSGSGKSSLVRAGVVPELLSDRLQDTNSDWLVALTTPGTEPSNNLALAFGKAVQKYFQEKELEGRKGLRSADEVEAWSEAINDALKIGSLGVVRAFETAGLPERTHVLLVVDQFEELFRYKQRNQKDEAERFIEQLLRVTSGLVKNVYVIITMRSEFMGDCARFEGLAEAVNAGLYLTPRLSRDQLHEAITVPAERCGREIDPSLVLRLLNDVANDQDQLPVLQHALMRCWDKTSGTITESQYTEIGGANALNDHAEEIFKELTNLTDDPELTKGKRNSNIVRALFKRLTMPADRDGMLEDEPDGRRDPATLETIRSQTGFDFEEVRQIIERYRQKDCAFLLPSPELVKELKDTSMIDITHESLIRKWDQLGKWVREEAKSASVYRQLAEEASEVPENEVLNERRVNSISDDARRWNENWADRYGGRYEKTIGYVRRSQVALQKRKLEVKERELRRIESTLKRKQATRIRIIKLVLTYSLVAAVFLAFATWVFFPEVRKQQLEQDAEALAGKAALQADQFGGSTQERAALLDIKSIQTQHVPSNTNVSTWEGFQRIIRGIPIKDVRSEMTGQRIRDLFSNRSLRESDSRFFVVSGLQPDGDSRKVLTLSVRGSTPELIGPELGGLGSGQFTAISSYGRYASGLCQNKHAIIVDIHNRKSFSIECTQTIRSIVDSLDSERFITIESGKPPQEDVPVAGIVTAWEPSGKRICSLPWSVVMNVLLSPDGRHVAMIVQHKLQGNQLMQTAEIRTLGKVSTLKAKEGDISEFAPMAFSRDGEFFAIGGEHGQVFLKRYIKVEEKWKDWTYEQGATPKIYFLTKHGSSPVTALAFGNRTNLLASAGTDYVVRVEDVDVQYQDTEHKPTGRTKWSDSFARAASQMVFSRTDKFLGLALGENTARVKYASTGVETARVTHSSRVNSIAFSFDEALAVSASDGALLSSKDNKGGEIFSFATSRADLPRTLDLNCLSPQQASVNNDGTVLTAACTDIKVERTPAKKLMAAPVKNLVAAPSGEGTCAEATNLHFKPVTAEVFLLGKSAQHVNPVEPLKRLDTACPSGPDPPSCQVAVSANGSLAGAACEGRISLFNTDSKIFLRQETRDTSSSSGEPVCQAISIALSSEGTKLAVGDDCGEVFLYNTVALTRDLWDAPEKYSFGDQHAPGTEPITAVAFSMRSTMVAAGDSSGHIWIQRIGSQEPSTIPPFDGPIKRIMFSPDTDGNTDSTEVVFGNGVTATVLRLQGAKIRSQISHKAQVQAVAFAADGQEAAAGADNGVSVVHLSSPNWLNSVRLGILGWLTHSDPRFVRAPAASLSAIPGWVSPPSISNPPSKVYSVRFVGTNEVEVCADQPKLLEPVDRRGSPSLLSCTVRNLSLFGTEQLKVLCSNLREDLEIRGGLSYADVCPDKLPSGKRVPSSGSSH